MQLDNGTSVTFFNVNEEGETYDEHSTLDAALAVLTEFPNDTIVVCFADSGAATALREEID